MIRYLRDCAAALVLIALTVACVLIADRALDYLWRFP